MNHRRIFAAIADDARARFGAAIRYKPESWLMRLIGRLMFFNPTFMTQYVTTIGTAIYFTSRAEVDTERPDWETLAHEVQHVRDDQSHFAYKFRYLFPQVLALPSLLSPLAVLAIWWWPAIWFLLALAFLPFWAPWPSPGRHYFERRGYLVSMVCYALQGHAQWMRQPEFRKQWAKTYLNWSYYRMSWDDQQVLREVFEDVERAIAIVEGREHDPELSRLVAIVRAAQ